MIIVYSPFYSGNYYVNLQKRKVAMDVQVLETQGFLSQLALHAGIHQQIPSFPERLTAYHKALLEYDADNADNLFHPSIEIDSMSVAKTLLHWRDNLALCGWNCHTKTDGCTRLNALAEIDSYYQDEGLAKLLQKLMSQIELMKSGDVKIPHIYKELTIEIPCSLELMPDFIKPLLNSLKELGVRVVENSDDTSAKPKSITELNFTQQWKAEAWLAQQESEAYDVWINTDNKRLDNWLHMFGKPVCGCEMTNANPQITQMFLLAIQLFQRPLNVNTLLQYLSLPECPLSWRLRSHLAKAIASQGGFCNDKVQECIQNFIEREFKSEDDETPQEKTEKERKENYHKYLPFDLCDDKSAMTLADETDKVNVKTLTKFLDSIKKYASQRASALAENQPDDARIAQLRTVVEMIKGLLDQMATFSDDEISFSKLIQWAQSLYEDGNYTLYSAQVGSRMVINHPANMIDHAEKVIWCDFYGDVSYTLSTDFLSNYEIEQLEGQGVKLWNKENESNLMNFMLARPIYKADHLTIVTCDQQGATKLPQHPLYLQLPNKVEEESGDELYKQMATRKVKFIDNHREEDSTYIKFDAKEHPVTWRETESDSSLEKLLQTPFDYVMKYPLGFHEVTDNELKLSTTNGYVAHETIEMLFTAERGNIPLEEYVSTHYEETFHKALVRKGALLLLPEHHLDKERMHHQLKRCVNNLATIITNNELTVVKCEQEEIQDLKLKEEGGILIRGFIDMVLCDKDGNEVVFDLKWTSKKDKYKDVLENNRALQLAIYKAMLEKHEDSPRNVRTAYFEMPLGKLLSTDNYFQGDYCEFIKPEAVDDIMEQVRRGYSKRVEEINNGIIETADNVLLTELDYAQTGGVYPLEDDGKKKGPRKAENKYSDYKCFTI